MKSPVEERFTEFYEKWLNQHDDNLQLLLSVPKDPSHEQEHRLLVSKVTTHFKEYYTAKWAAAHEDVLVFFASSWLSPLETAYLWMTGWKPSLVFQLVSSLRHSPVPGASLAVISEEQMKKMEELRTRIRLEEEKVEREMERQQVSMADRQFVELARLASQAKGSYLINEVDGLVEVAIKRLLTGLERVMKMADCVRLKALKGVLDLLSPLQGLDFMAAASMLQIKLRKLGKE